MLNKQTKQAVKEWSESLAGLGPMLTGEDILTPMSEVRDAYTRMLANNPAPAGVSFTEVDIGGRTGNAGDSRQP